MSRMKTVITFLILLVTLLAFVACGKDKSEAVDASTSSQTESVADDEKEAVAKVDKEEKEDIAEKTKDEVEKTKDEAEDKQVNLTEREEQIIEELTEFGAEKYGVSVEAYIDTLKSDGLTPYTAQKQLADTMGISLEELYAYEKANKGQLSDEQKENNENMANALEEAGDLDLSDMEGLTTESLLGMESNEDGEIIPLEGDIEELFSYKIKEIRSIYDDETSYVVEYYSDGTVEETVNYFKELLENTEEYFFLSQDINSGAYVTGRVNGQLVTVAIEPLEEGLNVLFYVDKITKE